jgi:hypothetical protein
MPYRVEVHFGHGWEWLVTTDDELSAYRWRRTYREWPTRIIDEATGHIIASDSI